MKRLLVLLVAAAVLSGAATATRRRTRRPASVASAADVARAAMLQADRDFAKTGAAKDLESFISFIADDAHAFPDGAMSTGKPAFRAIWGPAFKDPGVTISWAPIVAEAAAFGDMGYTTGAYEIRSPGADGASVVRRGSYVTIWRKQADGSWKVALDVGVPIAPPKPPAEQTASAK